MKTLVELIALVCQIHTGSAQQAAQIQAECHSYYVECVEELHSSLSDEKKVEVCMSARPAQMEEDRRKKR